MSPPSAGAQVTAELRGTVLDSTTGAPIPGARIDLIGTTSHSFTTTDGRFSFRGVEPGPQQLRVTALGFRPVQVPLLMRNGVVQRVQVVLARAPVAVEELVVRGTGAPLVPGILVFGRATIDSSRARDLGQLLDGAPGLQVIRTGGVGSGATLSIQGSSPDEVLVLLDGTPLNDPLTGTADLATVPLGTIERVTVLRGAASARYGPGALAGVVTLESRQPTGTEFSGRAEGGSFEEVGLLARVSGSIHAGQWRLSGLALGEGRRGDGDFRYAIPPQRGGGEGRRQNADARVANLLGSASARLRGTGILGRVEWLAVERGMPGPVSQPTPTARQEQRRWSGSASFETVIGQWLVKADAVLRVQNAEYRDPAPPAGPAYEDSVEVREGAFRLQSSGAVGRGTVAIGTEYRRQRFGGSTLTRGAPTHVVSGGVWATGRQLFPTDAGDIELSAALRVDGATTLDKPFWSPRLGVAWSRGPVIVHAGWGQSFSPPTLSDQFFQEGVLVQPNPDLGPERVRGDWQVGVGVGPQMLGAIEVRGEVAAYRSDVDGMILWQPNFRFVWSPHNFDVRRRGIDLTLGLTHRPSNVSLRGGYGVIAVEYAGPVLMGQVAYRPVNSASIGAGVPLGRFRADLDARYVGTRRTVPGSSLNALPGYWIVDLGASASVPLGSWDSEAFFRIENLFDVRAALLADYPLPSRGVRLGWSAAY